MKIIFHHFDTKAKALEFCSQPVSVPFKLPSVESLSQSSPSRESPDYCDLLFNHYHPSSPGERLGGFVGCQINTWENLFSNPQVRGGHDTWMEQLHGRLPWRQTTLAALNQEQKDAASSVKFLFPGEETAHESKHYLFISRWGKGRTQRWWGISLSSWQGSSSGVCFPPPTRLV